MFQLYIKSKLFFSPVTHPNILHSVYSTLRVVMGATRLMKLRLGLQTG